MIPVDQTSLGWPEGNCWAACIATITEIPLDQLPKVELDEEGEPLRPRWWVAMEVYLRQRGWLLLYTREFADRPLKPKGYHVLGGKGPRCHEGEPIDHCVVALDGEPCHDPHPSRDGLVSLEDWWILMPLVG
jgi:hypothetical protein